MLKPWRCLIACFIAWVVATNHHIREVAITHRLLCHYDVFRLWRARVERHHRTLRQSEDLGWSVTFLTTNALATTKKSLIHRFCGFALWEFHAWAQPTKDIQAEVSSVIYLILNVIQYLPVVCSHHCSRILNERKSITTVVYPSAVLGDADHESDSSVKYNWLVLNIGLWSSYQTANVNAIPLFASARIIAIWRYASK